MVVPAAGWLPGSSARARPSKHFTRWRWSRSFWCIALLCAFVNFNEPVDAASPICPTCSATGFPAPWSPWSSNSAPASHDEVDQLRYLARSVSSSWNKWSASVQPNIKHPSRNSGYKTRSSPRTSRASCQKAAQDPKLDRAVSTNSLKSRAVASSNSWFVKNQHMMQTSKWRLKEAWIGIYGVYIYIYCSTFFYLWVLSRKFIPQTFGFKRGPIENIPKSNARVE